MIKAVKEKKKQKVLNVLLLVNYIILILYIRLDYQKIDQNVLEIL